MPPCPSTITVEGGGASIGALKGQFVAPAAASSEPRVQRAGVMDSFSIDRKIDGTDYRAVGTFAGERP